MSQFTTILSGIIPSNEIWYTTKNGRVLRQTDSKSTFRNGLKGHRYENGKGVLTYSNNFNELLDYFFYNCQDLESIVLPSSIKTIGYHAFYGCDSLSGILINELNFWYHIDFKDYLSNPLYYAHNLYLNGELINDIKCPDNLLEIKDFAFEHCYNLKTIDLNNVSIIGCHAFDSCTNIKDIVLSSTITHIKDGAFSNMCGNTLFVDSSEHIPSNKIEEEGIVYLLKDDTYYMWQETGYFPVFDVKDYDTNNTEIVLKLPSEKLEDKKYIDLTKYYVWGGYVLCLSAPSITNDIIVQTVTDIPFSQIDGTDYLLKDGLYYEWQNKYIALNYMPSDATTENTEIVTEIPVSQIANKNYIRTQELFIWGRYEKISNTPSDSNNENTLFVSSLPLFNVSTYTGELYLKSNDVNLEWIEKREVVIGDYVYEENINAYFATNVETTSGNSIEILSTPTNKIICEKIKYLNLNGYYYKWETNKYIFINNKPEESVIGLKNVVIKAKDAQFDYDCFKNCVNIDAVIVDNIDDWFTFKFGNKESNPVSYAHGITYNNEIVKEIRIPNYITEVKDFAFYNNSSLVSLVFENDALLERVGIASFQNCSNISTITLPNKVYSIGANAFHGTNWFDKQSKISYLTLANGDKILYCGVNSSEQSFNIDCYSISDNAFKNYEKLQTVSFSENVKYIGKESFCNCKNLNSITFGSGIISIGLDAFKECESINSVNIGNIGSWSKITFANILSNPLSLGSQLSVNGENTSTLDIPDGVIISNYAFYNCTSIEKVSLPSDITLDKIGGQSFYGCLNLKTVLNPSDANITRGGTDFGYVAHYADKVLNNTDIDGLFAFTKIQYDNEEPIYKLIEYLGNETEITLPDNYRGKQYTLSSLAFKNNTKITKIKLSVGVNNLDNDVFLNCTSLTEVDLSVSNINVISKGAFRNCNNLSTITLPSNINKIDNLAFSNCYSLEDITLPENLEFIGKDAFNNCNMLKKIILPKNLNKIEETAFSGDTYLDLIINTSNLNVVKGETSNGYIGYYANKVINSPGGLVVDNFVFHELEGQYYLSGYFGENESITTPNDFNGNKYIIANNAFQDDSNIHEINISSGVTAIGDYSFYNCQNLSKITVGTNVISIGNYAFAKCPLLSSLVLPRKLTNIGKGTFSDCENLERVNFRQTKLILDIDAFKNCTNLKTVITTNENDWSGFTFKSILSNPLYYSKKLYTINTEITNLVLNNAIIQPFTFINCENIKSVTLNNTRIIAEYAFCNCTSIFGLTIPSSITSISEYAFKNCINLNRIINFSNLEIKKGNGFYADKIYNIPNGVLYNNFIFVTNNGVNKLVKYIGIAIKVMLPENYNNEPYIIAKNTFANSKIENIVFTTGVTSIEDSAFENCVSLTSISLPNTITSIGISAFAGCTNLLNIDFPEVPIEIKNNAFFKCDNIETVNIKTLELWCNNKYYNLYANPMYCSNKNVINNVISSNLIIPETIATVSQYTFAGCKIITSVTIPSTVSKIETGVFNGCTSIEKVIINEKPGASNSLETNCNRYENNEWYGLFHDCPLKSIELKRDVKDGLHQINTSSAYYSWGEIGYKLNDNTPIDSTIDNTKIVTKIPKEKINSDTIKYLALDISENTYKKVYEYYKWVGSYKLLSNTPNYYTITNTIELETLPNMRQNEYKYVLCNKKYYIWCGEGVVIEIPFLKDNADGAGGG